MEDRRLNEKESLELISQMIQNTKTRVVKHAGTPFLIWGYATVLIALVVWYLVTSTGNYQWNLLWFVLPIVCIPFNYWANRKRESVVKTYVDRVVNYIWIVFGGTAFLISTAAFIIPVPILFVILLLMGMGTILTGMVIQFKVAVVCGILGTLASLGCLWVAGIDQLLVFAVTFVFMMIIPGHVLNVTAKTK